MSDITIGVSPAYHLSRYGDRFSPGDVAKSLPDILDMGFSSFQLEVFHPDSLSHWVRRGAAQIAGAAERYGIEASQFAGHFLLHGFDSPEALESDFGINELRSCLAILEPFSRCPVITVVIPSFSLSGRTASREWYHRLWDRLVEKLRIMLDIAEGGGKKLALEILPGSLVGGSQGLLRLIEALGSSHFGYNFDTGHAWAGRELIELIPGMLGERIFGTHLKDNDQAVNRALVPGEGTIPWDALLRNLLQSGYRGSFDLEIQCENGEVRSAYGRGLEFIKLKLTGAFAELG
jgi:sugar phosphate isomerase/epimerase